MLAAHTALLLPAHKHTQRQPNPGSRTISRYLSASCPPVPEPNRVNVVFGGLVPALAAGSLTADIRIKSLCDGG